MAECGPYLPLVVTEGLEQPIRVMTQAPFSLVRDVDRNTQLLGRVFGCSSSGRRSESRRRPGRHPLGIEPSTHSPVRDHARMVLIRHLNHRLLNACFGSVYHNTFAPDGGPAPSGVDTRICSNFVRTTSFSVRQYDAISSIAQLRRASSRSVSVQHRRGTSKSNRGAGRSSASRSTASGLGALTFGGRRLMAYAPFERSIAAVTLTNPVRSRW